MLPRLSHTADHGVLWFGTAAALALTGRRGRRAALRGVASLAVTSALVNGPAKWAFRRTRPLLTDVPTLRQLARQPRTTSFPSGHSASAAAFATGVVMQTPAVGLPVAAAAAAVAYSRVHTGVHYPGDVLAGVTIGVVGALLVRRVWPVPPEPSREVPPAGRAPAPATPDGAGLVVVVNAGSGSGDGADVGAHLRERLPAAEVVVIGPDDDLDAALERAAGRASLLGVAGGDGTVNRAAATALSRGLPLAVFPAGTLNHFAGELRLDDLDDTVEAVRQGSAVAVSVGSAEPDGEGMLFLNTFSLGIYPELVRHRRTYERWTGKWLALALGLVVALRRAEPMAASVDGVDRRVWLLFAGNGRYHPPGFAPTWRERLDGDEIDVRTVYADRRWARMRLVSAVLSGRLGRCRVYEERTVQRLEVALRGGDEELARDGETEPAPRRVVLRPAARRLVVYRPTAG